MVLANNNTQDFAIIFRLIKLDCILKNKQKSTFKVIVVVSSALLVLGRRFLIVCGIT